MEAVGDNGDNGDGEAGIPSSAIVGRDPSSVRRGSAAWAGMRRMRAAGGASTARAPEVGCDILRGRPPW